MVACEEPRKKLLWLYYGDRVLTGLLFPPGTTINEETLQEARQRTLNQLDVIPGLICEPFERPFEARAKVTFHSHLRE